MTLTWGDLQVPPAHCTAGGVKASKTDSARQHMAEQQCLLPSGQAPWENVQPTFTISALVSSALKAKRQAVILAITCGKVIEVITWIFKGSH